MRGRWVVRLPTWLGDTVMAVPTIRALERACGDGLTLWGPTGYGRLLQAAGVGAGLLPYRRRSGPGGLLDVAAAVRDLVRLHPDGALLLPNAFEPALIVAVAGVRRRVGYATESRRLLLTDAPEPPGALAPVHDADRYSGLLEPLRLPMPRPEDSLLSVSHRRRDVGRDLLRGARRPLGLVPGSSNSVAKQWPAEYYARLAELAHERWEATPVLLGGPDDRAVVGSVAEQARVPCLDLSGRTGILELAAVLALCRAVVSNDTGSAHLAAALGRPTLVLFGPTDPERTRARGPHVRIASTGVFCQPCRMKLCPLDHRCMLTLAPELVLDRLAPLWSTGATLTAS